MRGLRGLCFIILLTNLLLYAKANPVPLIFNPLVPVSAPPGAPAFTLTVNGTGFVDGARVYWNRSPRRTIFLSGLRLTANITAADVTNVGTASVMVINPAPGGGASNVIFFPVTNPSSSVTFTSAQLYSDGLLSISSADFNADGTLDLVVGYISYAIGVLIGNGDGTFKPVVKYDTGLNQPNAIVVGDYNGDHRIDLGIAAPSGTISVFLGNGDGTFQPPLDYEAKMSGWTAAVAADFDADGMLDLAVLSLSTKGVLLILHGDGNSSFRPVAHYEVGLYPVGLTVGDFNDDGKDDLVVTSETRQVFVLLGRGDGTFQRPLSFDTGGDPQSVITADLNGDGKLDLITADRGANAISVLMGNGDGTFQHHREYLAGSLPTVPVAGDFNGDGKLDVALGGEVDLSILLGNGDGTFQSPFTFPSIFPGVVFAGDFDNNGRLDLAGTSNGLTILLQTGN